MVWDPREGSHLEAFAFQTYSAVIVFVAFTIQVLVRRGIMGPHVECFLLLAAIMDIYSLGGGCVRHAPDLGMKSCRYVVMFVELYPWLAIPKLHFLLHMPRIVQASG